MRSLKMATWTSGEPVSAGLLAYSVISACLRSAVIDIDPASLSEIDHPQRLQAAVFDPGERDQRTAQPGADDRALSESAEPFSRLGSTRRHALPTTQPRSLGLRQGKSRDTVQSRLDRQQIIAIVIIAPSSQGFQRNRLRLGEAPDGKAAQQCDMADSSERHGEIAGKSSDIDPLADLGDEIGMIGVGCCNKS